MKKMNNRVLMLPLLLLPTLALAGPGWQATTLSVNAGKAGEVVAAFDKLLNSKIGKESKGRVTLQANVADGEDPATHTVVVYYRSAAEREPYAQKMGASKEWAEFMDTMADLGTQVGTYRGTQIKSWGEVVNTDVVWVDYFFSVSDPARMVAVMDHFMNSPTGKNSPGQVHLAAINMGGMDGPSHVVSVGFASEAEMESWSDTLQGNADWQAQLQALSTVSEYRGANLLRDVKSWGQASLKDVTSR